MLEEIRDLANKPTPQQLGVTVAKVDSLIALLIDSAELIPTPPEVFVHPIDPDDSPYVNLAIAAEAHLIVSRDRHLLNLNNPAKPWSAVFRHQYPQLRVLAAETFLREIRPTT